MLDGSAKAVKGAEVQNVEVDPRPAEFRVSTTTSVRGPGNQHAGALHRSTVRLKPQAGSDTSLRLSRPGLLNDHRVHVTLTYK